MFPFLGKRFGSGKRAAASVALLDELLLDEDDDPPICCRPPIASLALAALPRYSGAKSLLPAPNALSLLPAALDTRVAFCSSSSPHSFSLQDSSGFSIEQRRGTSQIAAQYLQRARRLLRRDALEEALLRHEEAALDEHNAHNGALTRVSRATPRTSSSVVSATQQLRLDVSQTDIDLSPLSAVHSSLQQRDVGRLERDTRLTTRAFTAPPAARARPASAAAAE